MALTQPQLVILKNDIAADSNFNTLPKTVDNHIYIADQYNKIIVPSFTVWKTNVPTVEVGQKFNGTELAGLTTANATRLQTIAAYLTYVNPSVPDVRQFFDDVFSGAGGTATRANLLALWKRFATRAEKLYATGTGTDSTPAVLGYEGPISYQDVDSARNLP